MIRCLLVTIVFMLVPRNNYAANLDPPKDLHKTIFAELDKNHNQELDGEELYGFRNSMEVVYSARVFDEVARDVMHVRQLKNMSRKIDEDALQELLERMFPRVFTRRNHFRGSSVDRQHFIDDYKKDKRHFYAEVVHTPSPDQARALIEEYHMRKHLVSIMDEDENDYVSLAEFSNSLHSFGQIKDHILMLTTFLRYAKQGVLSKDQIYMAINHLTERNTCKNFYVDETNCSILKTHMSTTPQGWRKSAIEDDIIIVRDNFYTAYKGPSHDRSPMQGY